jgi:hypothetical protein
MSVTAHTNAFQLFLYDLEDSISDESVFLGIGLKPVRLRHRRCFEAMASDNHMRWFCLSLLLVARSVALVGSASGPSAAQKKQLSEFEQSMLTEHNRVRQKFIVPPLIWDERLAASAQEWANKIAASGVLPPARRTNISNGENVFWGTADQWPPKDLLEVWEAESKNYDRATNTCARGKSCVHFTQVVWSTTTKVGCGKAKSADGQTDFFVCDYNPPGNYVGQSPFSSTKRE